MLYRSLRTAEQSSIIDALEIVYENFEKVVFNNESFLQSHAVVEATEGVSTLIELSGCTAEMPPPEVPICDIIPVRYIFFAHAMTQDTLCR